ncbi:MAG: hypothetical protein MJB14_13395, partial [Spirochaetes bacterium]|nr:hypothetical protein [Spirochaetota bacterium]
HLYQSIGARAIRSYTRLNDTLLLAFTISREGVLQVESIEQDSLVRVELPHMEQWIMESIDSLPDVTPAYKRGIPVHTQFTLPIVLRTEGQ